MQLKQEMVIRLILTVGLVFVVGKIIGNILASFRQQGSERGNYKDIDQLIEREKKMLRMEQGLAENTQREIQKPESKNHSQTLKKYKASNHSVVIKWLEGLQWGTGDEFNFIAGKLNQQYSVQITTTTLGQIFSAMVNRDFLIKFSELPDKDQVAKLIELKAILDIILEEFQLEQNGGSLIESLARSKNVGQWEMARALEMIFYQHELSNIKLLKQVLQKPGHLKKMSQNQRSDIIWKEMKSADRPANLSLFLSRADKFMAQVMPFSPLPTMIDKNDEENALRIFGFQQNPGNDILKKAYKKLATSRHPDKMSGQAMDEELTKIVHNNFSKIQSAWDLLKK